LSSKENYKDGKRDGLWEGYHENGQLIFKFCYKNGGIIDMSYCEK
jgi:antitoxin component YwqK of YwqJK toxin-antitoxin module